ncbi:hypothetical protein M2459_001740 [Parabacteroides sp. PF5-5]|uniref:hypothetical protein n=1 Tax=unclassified Parabacteroides TaxID=2649774 RepID=UPI0024767A58|nr:MULTISPECIES: hypothetical protein [unclassified Parabacteroides]MDH6305003.1 hypothetical protein [Parabacteroides sp. PH5-39]MDH6315912.1 hypothetical protein [Parabacteroides sp. PF5-13]MDH6319569.1 hypothetical protein [Parabacteroides sp. PH5-13]MDH6323300.1 hypothetical protein [Parabacteroides sp. PH5-8]MDH6327192.1 hypothetical protein [Parabacteroides sp. PH5-41]
MKQIFLVIVGFLLLTVSCNDDDLLGHGDFAEACFSLSVELPQLKTGDSIYSFNSERITVYYGDVLQTSFQQAKLQGDSLMFNYPVLLKVGDPGRLRGIYVDETFFPRIEDAETLADTLYVDSDDPSTINIDYVEDKYKVKLLFKHCNALVDLKVFAKGNKEVTDQIDRITVLVDKEEGNGLKYADKGSKIILPDACILKKIALHLKNGKDVIVENTANFLLKRNKRYPMQISLSPLQLLVETEDGIEDWQE